MQAHPVPQNIMQVEFQLVGNLTLRQFGYIAGAGILAWAVFASPLFFIIRAPIAAAIALLGLALAFLPVNDMRLEKWIIAFFKAIYSPTRRVWLKEANAVDFLTDRFSTTVARPAVVHTNRAANRARLDLYLSTNRKLIKNTIDDLEERKLQTLDFSVAAPAHLAEAPNLAPETLPDLEPVEQQRIVEEQPHNTGKIASKVIFKPIATIKLPNKNIFVKALSNKRKHSLNPKTAQQGTILLPVRGERIFQVSSEIKEKLSKYVKPTPNSPLTTSRPEVLLRETPLPTPPPAQPQPLTAQMPHLPEQKPALAKSPPPPPQPPVVKQTKPSEPVNAPHAEPRPVINVFVTPQPVSAPPPSVPPPFTKPEPLATPPQSELPPIIINQPTPPMPQPIIIQSQTPEPAPLSQPPPPPAPENNDSMRENLQQLTSEESKLKGELERYKQQEKYLESQLTQSRTENESNNNNAKLKELEDQIIKMQHEKEEAEQRAQKLEGLISQMSTTQPKPNLNREIITPSVAEPVKAPEVHVVAPRRAEGKMAPPMTTVPNVINGVVKDANGLLLSETIIVVKDKNDEPVRALKTNKVGQFAISTALPNGTYLMEVEKEGYEFDYIEIKLTGEILAPIEIRSRGGTR